MLYLTTETKEQNDSTQAPPSRVNLCEKRLKSLFTSVYSFPNC